MEEDDEPRSDVDLTSLNGVGPRTAEALRSAGITTMADLARTGAEELAGRLAEVGAPTPASKIIANRWHVDAWSAWRAGPQFDEALLAPSEPAEAGGAASDAAGPPDRPADRPLPGGPSAPGDEGDDGTEDVSTRPDWEEYASFIVCFDRRSGADEEWQTRVWDTRSMVEVVSPGTAPGVWIGFILDRMDLRPSR